MVIEKIKKRFMDLNQSYIDSVNSENIVDKVTINSVMPMAYESSSLLRRKPIQVLVDH